MSYREFVSVWSTPHRHAFPLRRLPLIEPLAHTGEIPRQSFVHAFDRVIGDRRENLGKIVLRIQPVQFRRLCRAPNYAERIRCLQKWP